MSTPRRAGAASKPESAHQIMLKQPLYGDAERRFVAAMNAAADEGVGFGFMQQVAEWEWLHRTGENGGAWGPNFWMNRIDDLEEEIKALKKRLKGN